MEHLERIPELAGVEIHPQSFAQLLTARPPEGVLAKLKLWGVVNYASVFSRAIGLNAVYQQPPDFTSFSDEFLRSYDKYADHFYTCFLELHSHRTITAANFNFELYASGEYAGMLESEWGTA